MTQPAAEAHSLMIAVECSRLARDTRGIGRYVRALLPRLLAQRPALRMIAFARARDEVDELRWALDELGLPAARVETRLFGDLRASDADLWWYPWNVTRPVHRTGTVVATVHDVSPLVYPDPRRTKWWQNRRWQRLYDATVRRSNVMLTVSGFTAGELRRVLDVPRDRVRVTPLAADDFPVPPVSRDADVLARLGVRVPFVLAVGTKDRRKNLALLDRAMPHVVDLLPSAKLVVVGQLNAEDAGGDAPWRHAVGFVSEADLASLYRSARALVMPSLYEGFGLPVLEAMRLGAPVICARTSSLLEVGGDAARFVSPTDEGQLALAILQLFTDDVTYGTMQRAGVAHAARFSWDDTARRTLAAFDDALRR